MKRQIIAIIMLVIISCMSLVSAQSTKTVLWKTYM